MAVMFGFLLSIAGTWLSIKLAFRMKALDCPNEIKIHTSPIPAFGGLGILLGSLFSSFMTTYLKGSSCFHMLPIAIGALVMFVIGFVDDIQTFTPAWKLVGQIGAAVTYVVSALSLSPRPITPVGTWIIGMELCWITLLSVGLSNSFNLFDGMDGVLAGTAAIMAVAGSAIARIGSNPCWSIMLFAVAGSCMGFLVFNAPPARTFMGDCGSLYLGYVFGIAVYQLAFHKAMPMAHVFAWLTILALPICDTAFAVIRRAGSRAGLLLGDRRHTYDMLCERLADNELNTALVVWCSAAVLGVLGVWIAHMAGGFWPPVMTLLRTSSISCWRSSRVSSRKRQVVLTWVSPRVCAIIPRKETNMDEYLTIM
jgi:UDP-GlcNAc:undecaprenyl-phosphate GlcNAc-1-phosphate transferase